MPEFLALAAALDDRAELGRHAPLVEEHLSPLETARIFVADPIALSSLPYNAFGGAYKPGAKFVMSASEPLQELSD